MNLQKLILNRLKSLYDFHEYEVSKDNMLILSKMMIDIMPGISEKQIDQFFDSVSKGEYGVLYKMPTCLLSMFQRFRKENVRIMP